ncbi:MAG: hypothetical protein LUG86_03320 [Oscillospiraceae bacterium]|nr:hypothetical protein [Oscillospiraceae bacterium]
MQIIILAGGEGTRLRPLTADTPKPLVRVLGIPAIERLTALLFRSGFKEATIADFYLADKLEETLGSFSNGIKLGYVREDVPLGTAGCVRKAWNGDDVMVLSGDGVCDFNLPRIIDFHERNEADVTIVSHEVSDPREYGLVTADETGRVIGFSEKPAYDSCLTDLANTGAYVISKDIISRIPENEKVDFASDVFPEILKTGGRIFTIPETGIWFDIGDISSLLSCQSALLDEENKDYLIFEGCSVENGTTVTGGSVIEHGATVGRNCRIQSSLVMNGSSMGDGCELNKCVICEDVTIGRGVTFGELSAVGAGSVIGSAVTIAPGVKISPNSKIPAGIRVRRDVTPSGYKLLEMGEGGRADGIELTTENLMFLGKAIAKAFPEESITVGCSRDSASMLEALSLGLRSCGTAVYYLNDASFGETVFSARRLKTKYAAYISDSSVRIFHSGNCELARSEERKLCEKYNRAELADTETAPLINADAERKLYLDELRSILPGDFAGSVQISSRVTREKEIFTEAMRSLDWSDGEKLKFTVGNSIEDTVCEFPGGRMTYEQLLLLACRSRFSEGENVVLPDGSPLVCDEYAKESGSRVFRISPPDSGELSMFSIDPLFLIAEAIRYLRRREISASVALSELPSICYYRKTARIGKGLPKLLNREFSENRHGSDIIVESADARAFVRPMKSGKELRMYVESVSQEAATAICQDILSRLKAHQS